MEEGNSIIQELKNLKEASDRHEHNMEVFHHTYTKSIKDLSNQVHSLSLKMEQSFQIKDTTLDFPRSWFPQIELPKFSGEGFNDWLYKCNQVFEMYDNSIPDDTKVKLTSIHLEGKALRWHRKFAGTINFPLSWKEYVLEMGIKFGDQKSESGAKESKSTPQIETKKPRQRICRLRQTNDDDEIQELETSHPRFGPIYYSTDDDYSSAKEEAWQLLLKNSTNREAVTTEIYMSAMRGIEKEARDCYADGAADFLTGSQFRWMMIMDGCFFLQLALHLLGGSQQLGYPLDHTIFGKRSNSRFRDVRVWIEAMFFVGNQIPFVVLKELMKQSYFQRVVKQGKWEQPLDGFSRIALYELLLLPELEAQRSRAWREVKGLFMKVFATRVHWIQQQKATDLLHGLQLMILGPELDMYEEEEEDEEEVEDLEAQLELINSAGVIDDKMSSSATDLKQAGIHFWLSQGIGSRGIHFTNSMFFCHGYAILYLPPIYIQDDTELIFKCVRNYETSQKRVTAKLEVCSYLHFMSEIICTPDDAKILASKGIIKGNLKHKQKLPGILRGLALKNTYNQNLRLVKLKISDYTPPIWKKYWQIISFGVIITALQTVYTILPYYRKN